MPLRPQSARHGCRGLYRQASHRRLKERSSGALRLRRIRWQGKAIVHFLGGRGRFLQ